MGSDWLGYRFRNKSDWFGINKFQSETLKFQSELLIPNGRIEFKKKYKQRSVKSQLNSVKKWLIGT